MTAARERVLDHLENVAAICVITGSAFFLGSLQASLGTSATRVVTRTFERRDGVKYLVVWKFDAFEVWLKRMERDFGLREGARE